MTEELNRAAQQALEALEHAEKDVADFQRLNTDQTSVAIKALRQALTTTQPAQEGEAFESVLIDGVAYDLQAPVAAELLRLHLELQARASLPTQPAAQATPEPVQLDVVRQAIEDRDAMESRYHDLAHNLTYQGNSVAWWHSKATAYRNAIDEVWSALKVAGIRADGTKTCADGVRELAATPEPVGEAVAWWYGTHPRPSIETIRLDHTFTDHAGEYIKGRPLVFGDAHPAPGVPDVEDLRDRLVAISAAVADSDDRAAQAMLGEILRALAAAQAKGGDHG